MKSRLERKSIKPSNNAVNFVGPVPKITKTRTLEDGREKRLERSLSLRSAVFPWALFLDKNKINPFLKNKK